MQGKMKYMNVQQQQQQQYTALHFVVFTPLTAILSNTSVCLMTTRTVYTYVYMYICLHIIIYIYLYEGFVALSCQSLFMLVVVILVPKICLLVSFFLFLR